MPSAPRTMLLALAVIQNVGVAVLMATLHWSGPASMGFLALDMGLLAVVAMERFGERNRWAYLPPAVVVWLGAYAAGIPPSLAGLAIALSAPTEICVSRQGLERERVGATLRTWSALGAVPLFVLANAGYSVSDVTFSADALPLFWGVASGLSLATPLGVVGSAWLVTRLVGRALPDGLSWCHMSVVGAALGIGFSTSMFIAALGLPSGGILETCKLAVLVGSAISAGLAYGLGRLSSRAGTALIAD